MQHNRSYDSIERRNTTLLNLIRKKSRYFSLLMIMAFLSLMMKPLNSYGLTGGPSTPEVNAPSKIAAGGMVNPFTGDLDYSIPLLEVGGYPLTLSYNADVTMDQEASWVGLGWTLNPGVAKRSVRGLPDDFKGEDKVKRAYNIKDSKKAGLGAGVNLEVFSIDPLAAGLALSLGVFWDNYLGIGLNYTASPSISVATGSKGTLTASLGISAGSHQRGTSVSPSLSFGQQTHKTKKTASSGSTGIGFTFNSMSGMKSINVGGGQKKNALGFKGSFDNYVDDTYDPNIEFPMRSNHGAFKLAIGGEGYGIFGGGNINGYFSNNKLVTNERTVSAYGYLYTQHANEKSDVLLDFKREKESSFEAHQPNIAMPIYTHDVFQVSGAEISGSFRAHRGDIGMLHDPKVISKGGAKDAKNISGLSISGEVGVGNLVKIGMNLKQSGSINKSIAWRSLNNMANKVTPVAMEEADNRVYEPVYFKRSGNISALNNLDFYESIYFDKPASVLIDGNIKGKAFNILTTKDSTNKLENVTYRNKREIRSRAISYLDAVKASRVGLNRKILSYKINTSPLIASNPIEDTINRISDNRKKHHLSQVMVKNRKGQNYIYGIPAYNFVKKEVSFTLDPNKSVQFRNNNKDCSKGLIEYDNNDASINNDNGKKHYYSATTTPPYAYSYLLSAVVSDDYVDLGGDGPTEDDLGTYTRFNYTRITDNYKWRTPYKKHHANYQENYYSRDVDNLGSYMYGEKEIWYVHSIETRNYIAEFILTDRNDRLGAQSEQGGKGNPVKNSQKLKKLSKIKLYTKAERKEKGTDAVPVKTVHFEYDYSLCPGVPNHMQKGSGKLTLKEVYFTYGDSKKGRFSPYQFAYSNTNPTYNMKAVDRFGFYKPTNCSSGSMSNGENPYVVQDTAKTNKYVEAWTLKNISLPSGATVSIDYESDQYAYVQDKPAMQMYKVAGFSTSNNPGTGQLVDKLYDNVTQKVGGYEYDINNYLFFDLDDNVSSQAELDKYFRDMNRIMFKCKVDVIGSGRNNPHDHYEYITGFAEFEDYGFHENSRQGGSYGQAWVKLKKVKIGDFKLKFKQDKANPIARRAFIFSKYNLPKYAFDRTDNTNSVGQQLAHAVKSIDKLVTMFKSLNSELIQRNFAQKVDLSKSMIRLYNPINRKLGGGHRVKRLVMSDEWGSMTQSHKSSTYGREYNYDTEETGQTISSGVISMEPKVGSEENPLKQAVFYTHNEDQKYMLEPFGEGLFPAPVVGYSRVKITNLSHPNVNEAPAGFEVHEHYTARDFPVKTARTNLQNKHAKPGAGAQFNPFKFKYEEIRAVSQGYKVETNNMHGKKKARYTFRHGSNAPLTGQEYKYKTDREGNLVNRVEVVDASNTIKEAVMGMNIDFVVDSREQFSKTKTGGVNMNIDGFLVAIAPVMIPIPLPIVKTEVTIFRSLATTKLIERRGILEEVVSYKNGAQLREENLVYSPVTGNPLVKQQANEFGDHQYKTKIPSYHEYAAMGPSYRNIKAYFKQVSVSGGEIADQSINEHLQEGDKLYYIQSDDPSTHNKAWVLNATNVSSVLINTNGELVPDGTYDFTVVESGFKDKSATNVGEYVSLNNPVQDNQLNVANLKILSANASQYKDDWQTYMGIKVRHDPSECNCSQIPQRKGAELQGVMRQIVLHEPPMDTLKQTRAAQFIMDKIPGQADYITIHQRPFANRMEVFFKKNGEGEKYCQMTLKNKDGINFPAMGGTFSNYQYIDNDPYTCDEKLYDFEVDYTWMGEDQQQKTVRMEVSQECFPIAECSEKPLQTYYTCNLSPGDVVNPFVNGIKGNWREYISYVYKADRTGGRVDQSGYYESFSPFNWQSSQNTGWYRQARTTIRDPFNNPLEEMDPLDVYATEIYGYGYTKSKALVKNARHYEAGYTGFEDEGYDNFVNPMGDCEPLDHFEFITQAGTIYSPTGIIQGAAVTVSTNHHTGNYSAPVSSASPLYMERDVKGSASSQTQGGGKRYRLKEDDFAGIFTPSPGKYFVSAWVKDSIGSTTFNTLTYDNPKITIEVDGSKVATLRPSGPIIDKWQQISGSFTIPDDARDIRVNLATDLGYVFYDDVRIHPYDAQMEAYVYDLSNMNYRAKLDYNNYATFYNYNKEGKLNGVKQETTQGILTVKEVRRGDYKKTK